MTKWEYKDLEAGNHKFFMEKAVDLGQNGWELISLFETAGFTMGIFKRPVEGK